MNNFRADLHCHSNCSDGTMSPEELIQHAKAIGLSGISITDHDTISAYSQAIATAQKWEIALGSGVEFSSVDEGVSVHVLGYDVDLESEELAGLCQRHIERRKNRNNKILEKLAARGMIIEVDQDDHIIGRPHIALALQSKGHVKTIQEAFDLWIGDGKPCFDPGVPISTDETLEVIHAAGGKAFLAHPHLLRQRKAIDRLMEKPFDGLECFYSKCLPHQEQKWVTLAKKRNLLMSGGSDFHGSIKPGIPLGCSWVDQETFERIFEKHRW